MQNEIQTNGENAKLIFNTVDEWEDRLDQMGSLADLNELAKMFKAAPGKCPSLPILHDWLMANGIDPKRA